MSDVAIVDYGINNVRSVRNAVEYCGYDPVVTHDAAVIADASHVILPGVGAFGDAMNNIRARGIDEMLDRHVREKGKPFLAVCLGMQLLAQTSEEHADDGVLHVTDWVYLELNESGSRIWELLESQPNLQTLTDQLVSEFAVDRALCEQETAEFLADLTTKHFAVAIN